MSDKAATTPAVESTPVEKTECANGHPRAEFWTTTEKGRSYCKACARAASKASKAKNAKPNPKRLTPEVRDFLVELLQASKKGSAELREQTAAFLEAHAS